MRCLTLGLGKVLYASQRGSLARRNLAGAFPERSAAWHHAVAREACCRAIEMGLLRLIAAEWPRERLAERYRPTAAFRENSARLASDTEPNLLLVAHFSQMEALLLWPWFVEAHPPVATIDRPFRQEAVDRWVRAGRQRAGIKMLPRNAGYGAAADWLAQGRALALHFDQNAGDQGGLTLFFDRVCSATPLPDRLAAAFEAPAAILWARRHAFLRAELDWIPLSCELEKTLFAAHQWLERTLEEADTEAADWLWLHRRWKASHQPRRCLNLQHRRDWLAETLAFQRKSKLPKREKIFVRLPNWLGDTVMTLPLLRALAMSRPDAQWILLVQPKFAALLAELLSEAELRCLPERKLPYFAIFWRWRRDFPSGHLVFPNSIRSGLEACFLGASNRLGIARPGRWRPGLTQPFRPEAAWLAPDRHQIELWSAFLQHFGLAASPIFKPLPMSVASPEDGAIGLIIGSENRPEKRWPTEHFKELIKTFPKRRFILFGTSAEAALAEAIARACPGQVRNEVGRTSLKELAKELAACRAVVGNDTGGIHLANLLGRPVVALFGPTNPAKTRPVFEAPLRIVQPPGAPSTGGGAMAAISVEAVARKLRELLHA